MLVTKEMVRAKTGSYNASIHRSDLNLLQQFSQ